MNNPVTEWAYELAAHLGYFNVDEMLASAPAGQLLKWRIHFEKKPFGTTWHPFSMVAAQIINKLSELESRHLGQREMKEEEYLKSDIFVPVFTKKGDDKKKAVGVGGMKAAFKSMLRLG